MRIYVRSLIDFGHVVVDLLEFAVAPERAAKRWINRAPTNRLQY